MERPVFSVSQPSPETGLDLKSQIRSVTALRDGAFDSLFSDARHKPSALYVEAMKPPVKPTVELIQKPDNAPFTLSLPSYPPLARAAHIGGRVAFHVSVDTEGRVTSVAIASGHPLLRGTVEAEARKWKFPAGASRAFDFVIEFSTNCPEQK
jgi:TonB family protein